MEYIIIKKQTVNGETTKTTTIKPTLTEARQNYHSALNSAYSTEGLEHVMCALLNDIGGVELKEYYYAPTEIPEE